MGPISKVGFKIHKRAVSSFFKGFRPSLGTSRRILFARIIFVFFFPTDRVNNGIPWTSNTRRGARTRAHVRCIEPRRIRWTNSVRSLIRVRPFLRNINGALIRRLRFAVYRRDVVNVAVPWRLCAEQEHGRITDPLIVVKFQNSNLWNSLPSSILSLSLLLSVSVSVCLPVCLSREREFASTIATRIPSRVDCLLNFTAPRNQRDFDICFVSN